MSFLPAAAPGAGHAFLCGLRDGSVVLVDPRQPSRGNGTSTTVATSLIAGGRGPTGSRGGSSRAGGVHGHVRGATLPINTSTAASTQSVLFRLDCSSVDHTHILRDGTRFLVKDRSGGLQVIDLRFQGHGRGRTPQLKVLVQPGKRRSLLPGRFALDRSETIVITPAAAAPPVVGGGGRGGTAVAGGGERSSSLAWNAFGSSSSSGSHHENGGGSASAGGMHVGGGIDTSLPAELASGDRIRILNVSSGEVLNDIRTPWTGVSLARGTAAAGVGGASSCRCYGGDVTRFWGSAWEHGRGAAVFEASLGAETAGGYGR